MYKFLFFFCTIFLMNFNLIYSQAYSISLAGPSGGVAGTAENQFVIQVKVGDPNAVINFLGASFNLTWDNTTYIEAVSSTAGAFLGNNPLIITQNYADHIEAGVTSSTGGKNGSGIIVSCTLKVKQTVSGTITAHFNLENITGMDGIGNSVILTPANNPLNVVIESLPVLSVTPDNQSVSSSAGTTSFSVTNTGGGTMNWTASENSDWINITSGSSGTNTGTINLSYTANTNCEARVCTLTVTAPGVSGSPKTVTITQPGSGTPVLSVTPLNQDVSSASGTTAFTVSNTGCGTMNWTASESSDWVNITSGSTGTNSGTINLSYTANTGTTVRVCTLTVAASGAGGSPKTLTITQQPQPQQQASISMTGPSSVTGIAENQFVIQIKVGDPNAVTNFLGASCNLTWDNTAYIEAVSTTAGSFLGSNPLIIAQNFSDHIEIGATSTSGGKNGTGVIAQCTLKVKQTLSGAVTIHFNLQNISGLDGSGNNITLLPVNNPLNVLIELQPVLTVTPDNQTVSASPGTTSFSVNNTGGGTMNWTASESSEWVSITSGSTGTNTGTINISYTANTGCETRVCTLTVTAAGAAGSPKTVTITQPGSGTPILTVSPLTQDLPSTAGTTVINVSNTGCGTMNWSASESSDWVDITSGSSGTNSGTINISYSANTGCETRVSTLTVIASGASGTPKTVTITQPGSGTPILTVSPLTQDLPSTAGTTAINVSNTGCGTMNWTASESSDWVDITSGSSGTNSGTINISYSANTGCETRVCTLTVTASGASGTPKTVTITQPGSGTPILTVSPLTQDLPSTAGTAAINVSNTGCGTMNWSASENSDWINITSGISGTNSGTINLSYTANTGCETRVCTLTVTAAGAAGSPKTVIITQPGSGTQILTVSPLTQELPSSSGTTTINVSNTGCGTMNWTASESSDWVNITSGSSGTNAGTINISYTSNTGCETRVCTLTVTASGASGTPKTVTITQPGSGTSILTVSPLTQELPSSSGTTAINVSNTGCGTMNWTASENSDWVSITSGTTGTNAGTINISYTSNTGCETRVCTLTVTASGASGTPKTVTITQPGSGTPILTVSPLTQDLPSTAGTAAINVSNTGCGTMNWSASENSDWINITSGISGTNSGTINLSYTANTGCETRVCTLIVAAQGVTGSPKLVTITQPGSGTPVLFAVPLSQELPSSAGTTEFNISNQGCGNLNWMVTETSDWVTITDGAAGVNAGLIKLSYSANVSCETRICSLTVTSEGAAGSPKILTLTQPGGGKPILEVTPLEHSVSPEEGIRTFTISNSGCGIIHWNASVREGSDWLTIDEGAAGADSGEIKCSYQANKTSKARTAKIIIYNSDSNDDSVLVSITQDFTSGVFNDQTVTEYCLYQNYPNPFNPTTVIRYSLPEEGKVTIRLFDVLGNEITTIVDDYKSPGMYSVELDASSITSGIYYYRITANNFVHTKKMILVK